MGQRSEVGIVLSKAAFDYIQTVELANECFDDCDYHFVSNETGEHLFAWESVKWNDYCAETWTLMQTLKNIDNKVPSNLDAGDYLFIKLGLYGLQELGVRYTNIFNFRYIGGCHTLGFSYDGVEYFTSL